MKTILEDMNTHTIVHLEGFEFQPPGKISDIAAQISGRRDSPPRLWTLLLGNPRETRDSRLDSIEQLSDIVYALIQTRTPVVSMAHGLLSGQSLALALFSIHTISTNDLTVRTMTESTDASDMAAFFALSVKLGQAKADAVVKVNTEMTAAQALEAGIISEISSSPDEALLRWIVSSFLADGSSKSRLIYQSLYWRFNAAFRTGLVELEVLRCSEKSDNR